MLVVKGAAREMPTGELNLFYTIMMFAGCVQKYHNAQYGSWDFKPMLHFVFREYRYYCDSIDFK